MRASWAVLSITAVMGSAQAQVQPPNRVSDCTLIVDPTALRACVESARQSRPAAIFDPSITPSAESGSAPADLLPRRTRQMRKSPDRPADGAKAPGTAETSPTRRLQIP